MPENIRLIFQDMSWPFFLSAVQAGGRGRVNYTRIIESLVIALVVVLAGYLFLIPQIQEKQTAAASQFKVLAVEVSKLRDTLTETRVQLGDRWTGTDHRRYLERHNARHLGEWREYRVTHAHKKGGG